MKFMRKVSSTFFILVGLSCIPLPLPSHAKKRVVNYVPPQGKPPPVEKPSQLPVYGGEKNMEEILDNPHFRYRKADLGEDPNIWGDALAAYEAMLKFRDNHQADPNGNPIGLYQPGLFVPWMDVSDSFAAKRELSPDLEDVGKGKLMGRQAGTGTGSGGGTTDSTTEDTTTTTTNETTPTTTTGTTPRPTRAPIQCPTNPTKPTTPRGPPGMPPEEAEKLFVYDRVMPQINIDKSVFDHCGEKAPDGKTCFGIELGCVAEKKCRILATVQNVNSAGQERVRITLLLTDRNMPSSPYIALGFSPDVFVGGKDGDYLFYCIDTKQVIPGESKEVALYMAHVSEDQTPKMQQTWPAFLSSMCMIGGFTDSRGILGCSFELNRIIEIEGSDENIMVDLLAQKYYQYLAFGHYDTSPGIDDPLFGNLHNVEATWFTSERVNISDPKILLPRSQFLIYFHVWFATAAFTFLMPSGSMMSKFGREVYNNERKLACYKMPQWLLTHIRLNFMSLILIIASLFIILIDVEFTWQSVGLYPMIHSVVGLVAMVGLFPLTGLTGWAFDFKNSYSSMDVPKTRTKIMAWVHWGLGNLTYFSGIICVVTAGKMQRALAPCMVEYFGWMHLGLHLGILWLMTIDTWKLVKWIDGRYMFQRAILGPMIPWTHGELPKVKKKNFSIATEWKMRRRVVMFHFIVSFLCTFAICVLMILPTVLCREDDSAFRSSHKTI